MTFFMLIKTLRERETRFLQGKHSRTFTDSTSVLIFKLIEIKTCLHLEEGASEQIISLKSLLIKIQ